MTFLEFRKLLYSCTEGMCHSSTYPGTSLQAFPMLVLQVTNAGARRSGYEAVTTHKAEMLTMQYSLYLCLTKLFTLPNVYVSVCNLGGPSPSHQLVLLVSSNVYMSVCNLGGPSPSHQLVLPVSSNVTSVAPAPPTSLCCQ